MKIGDKVQWNKMYNPDEVVLILEMDETHALIQFPTGTKITTRQTGLCPLNPPTAGSVKEPEGQKDHRQKSLLK